jgi:uncharacterized protein
MPTILAWVGIVLAIVVMVLAVVACLLGLPGSAVVLVVAAILSACTHWERPDWWVLLIFLGVVGVAETADNLLSAWGTKRYGGTGGAVVWAMVGGLLGALLGGVAVPTAGALGGPIPWLLGAVLGPLAGGMGGGYLGGYLYERRQGKPKEEARRAGWGAFLGRAAGGLLKALLSAAMAGITVWLLFRDGGPFGS